MTSTSAGPADSSHATSGHPGQPDAATFMLTLCPLAAPVSIRPPQSPHLKRFHFFTSRARQQDGTERLHLHMGYFKTLTDAEKCLELVRGRFPEAFASRAATGPLAPVGDESLTDTQVLKLLEARGGRPGRDGAAEKKTDEIPLVRPEDTDTRRALKEAVIEGAPVSFAVQLLWSEQSIDVSRVPLLDIFRRYALYATESRRAGRSRHFLRLGFFEDPIAAKEVASQVRSHFASAAVVPVTEDEATRTRDAHANTASIPYLLHQGDDEASNSSHTQAGVSEPKRLRERPSQGVKSAETLAQTLEQLAQRESLNDPDCLSESGVRHLKIEVERRDSPSRAARHRIEHMTRRMRLRWMGQG